MCTIFTSIDAPLIGRTMDFPPRSPWKMTFLPTGYRWRPAGSSRYFNNHHAILGGMREVAGHYLIGDGINDAGLFCAELFFPVAAEYPALEKKKEKLTPQDFIGWVLGQHSSVQAVITALSQVAISDSAWYDGQHYPFHWFLVDQSGTYIIEPVNGRLVVTKNGIGVLTNTPAFPCQKKRLQKILQEHETTLENVAAEDIRVIGANAVQRFQRAALARWGKRPHTVGQLLAILDQLAVTKNPQHAHNYTHYEAVVDHENLRYHFYDCQSR